MMRSSNPALNDDVFRAEIDETASRTMTLEGTVIKTAFLLAILLAAAAFTWSQTLVGVPVIVPEAAEVVAPPPVSPKLYPLMLTGFIGGTVLALITIFKPSLSPYTTPLYAGLEGLALGGISSLFEHRFPGIVVQAVGLTFGTLGALLFAYVTRVIRATENFKLGVAAATGGICLVYFAGFILRFFGVGIPYIHESGPIGIGFSLVVVAVAAFNLVLDFDFIETGVERRAPKYMEWYGGFGLLVTLVWLYLELLRLLSKLRSRD
jgi:uncharacterized YccA/Bax inhibitor family protein